MKVFLTGGSGFVGRHMLGLLQERGYTVRALARSEQTAKQLANLGAEVVRGDLLDEEAMIHGMQNTKAVFHVAGYLHGWGTYQDFYQVNVLGTERALSAAKAAGVQRFVQVGAAAVIINKRPVLNADESWPIQQKSFSPYIATKSIAEKLVIAANEPGFTTSVVRPSWIWGKGDQSLPRMVAMARKNSYVWINGGNYPYVTTHVMNVCHGALLAAEKGAGGQAYFIVDEGIVQFRQWIAQLLKTQNVNPGNRSIPYGLAWNMAWLMESFWRIMKRKDSPPLTQTMVRLIGQGMTFSDRKAREELGYVPIVTREAGLAELVGYAVPHRV